MAGGGGELTYATARFSKDMTSYMKASFTVDGSPVAVQLSRHRRRRVVVLPLPHRFELSMRAIQFPYWTIFVGSFFLPGTSICSFMLLADGHVTPIAAMGTLYSLLFVAMFAYVGSYLAHPTGGQPPAGSMWLLRRAVSDARAGGVGGQEVGFSLPMPRLAAWVRWRPSRDDGDPAFMIVVEDFTHTWVHIFAIAGRAVAVSSSPYTEVWQSGSSSRSHFSCRRMQRVNVAAYASMCVSVALSLWAALSSASNHDRSSSSSSSGTGGGINIDV